MAADFSNIDDLESMQECTQLKNSQTFGFQRTGDFLRSDLVTRMINGIRREHCRAQCIPHKMVRQDIGRAATLLVCHDGTPSFSKVHRSARLTFDMSIFISVIITSWGKNE